MTTTGLIIAAGAGTRLADSSKLPKPLRKVCGIPLIRRAIVTAARGGLKKIYIVVGYEKEKIMSYIRKRKWPVAIEFIENPDWKRSNGVSVLCAKDKLRENFILMMADHIFDYHILKDLANLPLDGRHGVLAVDHKVHQVFDQDDATKVLVAGGRVREIGKELVRFNGIDTGLFLLTPAVFDALEAVKREGDCTLTDGVRHLAHEQAVGVFDIGGRFWQDVDTKESLKFAEKMLLNSCRKTTDGFVSRYVNRPISLFISRHLVRTPLRANEVTIFVTFVGVASGILAAQGAYSTYLIGGILFQLASILDGVDGELSKLRMTDSKAGQWLDTISDNITYLAFIGGTGVHLYRTGYEFVALVVPVALFGVLMVLFWLFFYLLRYAHSGSFLAVQKAFLSQKETPLFSRIFLKLHFMIKRDFFALFFLLFAILGKPQWVMFAVALVANIGWVVIVQMKFWPLLGRKKVVGD